MITGRSGGSGKYSYQEAHYGHSSVHVSHMPEDSFSVRVVFRDKGETQVPILKISEVDATLLWSALKRMANDLGWDDRISSELPEDK